RVVPVREKLQRAAAVLPPALADRYHAAERVIARVRRALDRGQWHGQDVIGHARLRIDLQDILRTRAGELLARQFAFHGVVVLRYAGGLEVVAAANRPSRTDFSPVLRLPQ